MTRAGKGAVRQKRHRRRWRRNAAQGAAGARDCAAPTAGEGAVLSTTSGLVPSQARPLSSTAFLQHNENQSRSESVQQTLIDAGCLCLLPSWLGTEILNRPTALSSSCCEASLIETAARTDPSASFPQSFALVTPSKNHSCLYYTLLSRLPLTQYPT